MSPEQQPATQTIIHTQAHNQIPLTVDVRERAYGLITTLNLLNSAAVLDGRISQTYNRKNVMTATPEQAATASNVRSASMQERNRLLQASRKKFREVYELGNGPTPVSDPEFLQAFGSFYSTYYGPSKAGALKKQRKNLKSLYDALDPQLSLLDAPQDEEKNPSKKPKPQKPLIAKTEIDTSEQLTTRQKLEGLRDDPRASFIPATYDETSYAISLLDYVDNPRYGAASANQLQEIFVHQAKAKVPGQKFDPRKGQRAIRSVTFEMGDYLLQSIQQFEALSSLWDQIDACPNPSVTLLEEIGPSNVAYGPLIRYMDLLALRQRGATVAEYDPMSVVIDRSQPQPYDGKNKTLEDPYTAQNTKQEVLDRISDKVATLTIGQTRKLVQDAAINEERRANFWGARLKEVMKHGAAKPVAVQILTHADSFLSRAIVS